MYLDSTKVKVFPTAYRGKNDGKIFDPESRLNTEKNLTKIATKITSHDSFVVNRDFELSSGETEKLEVCLKGYLFELTLTFNDLSSFENFGKVIASVRINPKNPDYASDTTNTEYEGLSLSPFDGGQNILDNNNGEFIGLELYAGAIEEDDLYILEFKNNKWIVPTSSILRLDTSIVEDGLNSEKSIKEELHTGDVWIDNEKESTNSGLIVNTSGKLVKNNFTTSDPTASGNSYSYIDSISQNKIGKITATKKTIPDADANTKGLVNTDDQEFKGIKTFKDGLIAESTSGIYGIIGPANKSLDIETLQDQNLNLNTGSGKANYNGNEIATIDYMQSEGTSAFANRAKNLGDSNGLYSVGGENTPIYVSAGTVYPCYYSMVGLSKGSTGSPTNSKLLISDQTIGWDDNRGPYNDAFTYSNSDLIIDEAYLNGIAYNRSVGTSGKGAATLTLVIKKYPYDTFQITANKWLKIDLQQFLNHWFSGYEFHVYSGMVQEESFSFLAKRGSYSTFSGQTYRINQDKFWVIPYGNEIYIGAVGDSSIYSQLTITLYGNLLKIN